MADIILIKMRGLGGNAEVSLEEIYVCDLFKMEFWEMCMYTYILANDPVLSTSTPLKGVKAVYSS